MITRAAARFVAALAFVLAGCGGPTLAEVAVGQPEPDFRLRDLDGATGRA